MSNGFAATLVPVYVRKIGLVQEQVCIGFFARSQANDFYVYRLAKDDAAVKARVLGFLKSFKPEALERAFELAENAITYTFRREQEGDKGAFHNLVRPRENMVRYGEPMMVTIYDREEDVEKLYHECVGV